MERTAIVKHLSIAAAWLILAVAVIVALPGFAPGADAAFGWVLGAVIAVAGLVAHEALMRSDRAAESDHRAIALAAEIDDLRRDVADLRREALRLDENLAAVSEGGEGRARADLDRVVSEVRVLQNLIERLPAVRAADASANRESPAEPAPTVHSGLDETQLLDIVREGLRRDRVDLYLQPIVSLPQRKTRFYECFSRIRSDDGGLVLPEQYIAVAKKEGLVGAIDNLLLFRCVQLVRRAQSQKHSVGFFCNVSANSLEDRAFFADFLEFLDGNRGLASNLVFEFSQDDLEGRGVAFHDSIARLGRLGFDFSLDRVADLSKLNIPWLAQRGFRYIKLEAGTLMQAARPDAEAARAAAAEAGADTVLGLNISALKRALDRAGIDLIVEKLETEQDLVELLDFNIDFGQGFLFGQPHLSREV